MKASKKNNQSTEVKNNAVVEPQTERQSLFNLCKQLRAEYGTEERINTLLCIYYKKLHKVRMDAEWIGRKLYGVAICEVDDDWTDDDTAQLKEYLSGQYSDGWGEGFELREIDSFTETETCEEYDEEADEYYESEWEVRYDVYISFWQGDNYRIMTEAELKG